MYKIINRKKLLLVKLIDLLFNPCFTFYSFFRKRLFFRPVDSEPGANTILVVRFGYIGDVILTLPVFPLLRQMYPNSIITLLTSTKTSALVEGNPDIDRVLRFDAPWLYNGFSIKSVINYVFFLYTFRKENYDLGLDMRSDIRNIFLILFLGRVKRRVSFDFGGGHYMLTDAIPYRYLKHKIDLHLDVVRYLGSQDDTPAINLYVTAEEKNEAERIMQGMPTSDRPLCFALHPGARVPLKRWNLDKFMALTDELINRYPCMIILLGETNDFSVSDLEKWNHSPHVRSLVGKLNLRQLIAVLQRCSVLICNDSAPMHIGVAVQTPTVTIFGPSKSMETGPYYYGHKVVEKDFLCRYSCDETNCLNTEYKACLESISVADVLEAVHELVQRNNYFQDRH
ncbi:glycosyltransferase family 9 protein [bacterium]|nr:glycosyltransferase family 9 protein [bacterium]